MLRRNVLIFHSGALGDFVLTFPLAAAVARVYPQSRIFYVTSPERGAIVESLLRLEWTDGEAGWHLLFAPEAELPARAMSLLTGATTVFALHGPPAVWLENVARINPQARIIAVDPRVPADYSGHASQWALDQLIKHPVEYSATGQILKSLDSRGLAGAHAGGEGVLIHPGAGAPAKCWPLESFIELGKRLGAAGRAVRFILGEVERERWSEADRAALASVCTVLEPPTLRDLYQLLIKADVFVGNDSGPGHLAAIAGTPTVAIFGPTSPGMWRPLGPAVAVLDGNRVSVDEAVAAVEHFQSTQVKAPVADTAGDDD